MRPSEISEKRKREMGFCNAALRFIPGLTLSQHLREQQKDLFIMKLNDIIKAKSLHPTEFEGYTIRERFAKLGWEQLLNFNCDKIYRRVAIHWMASLSKNGDELTGIVDGKSYTITPAIIRDILKVDIRTDLPYACFNKFDFQTVSHENKGRWLEACMMVFGQNKNVVTGFTGYLRSQMTPVMKILWRIGVCMFHPRLEDIDCVSVREVYLLHALFTGDYLYSFAHLMIDDMWDMYEDKNRRNIPYGSYISEILNRCGAVPKDEYGEMVTPEFHVISRSSFLDLKFLQSPTYYIIEDRTTMQRVMFQKNVVEVPGHQIPIPNPHLDTTKLLKNETPSSKFQEQPKEHQALEAGHEELDREKRAEEREKRAEERDKRAGEREKRAEERERRAEILFQEMEKRAEIRAHAIIWDIERQRYFYEKEQEQLRMAWNQFNGVDDFQFPQICHTSFHPPQEGSQYYDSTQSNEIPKAFQSIYHDIYGPRR